MNKRNWPIGCEFSKKEFEKYFQKIAINITCHGKNTQGRIVISGKFKNPEIEKQKNELIEESMKENKKIVNKQEENLTRHFVDDGSSLIYSTEKVNENGVIKKTYCESKNEEKSKPIKQNTEKLEDKQAGETNSTQRNEVQVPKAKLSSSDSDWKSQTLIWGSIGGIGLLGIAVVVLKVKK
jgi:hypothetical protein